MAAAAAAGVRVLAISHTLLPTGVGNGFGRVAKGRRQNDSSGISTILLIQFSPLALPYALLLPLLHNDPKIELFDGLFFFNLEELMLNITVT